MLDMDVAVKLQQAQLAAATASHASFASDN